MKKLVISILILVISISLLGCDNASPSDNGDNGEYIEFIAPIRIDFSSIAPNVDVSAITKSVLRNMHDALYKYNSETLELELSLAESVVFEDDNRTITFKLKEGVKFHNDQEIKASDVVYSFMRLGGYTEDQTEVIDSTWYNLLNADDENGPGSIEAIDEYTVKFVLAASAAPSYFSTIHHRFADAFIIPEGLSNQDMERNPIGAGPYKFVEYRVSDSITFERFENYHGELPQINRVEFKIYNDDNAQYLAFRTGEVNMLVLNPANYQEVKAMDGVEVIEGLSQDIRQIWLNQREGSIFSNPLIRKAVNYAIDKQRILDVANGGLGSIHHTHLSELNPAYNHNLENVYYTDKELAIEMLAQAGYPNGFETSLSVVAENELSVDIATVIKDELSQVGIEVELKVLPWTEYYQVVYRDFNYEMAQLQIVAYPDAYRMLSRFMTTSSNFAGATNEEYDDLIIAAASEGDLELQNEYYKRAQQILVNDATNVFLIDQGVQVALNEGFSGYVNYPFAFTDIASIVKK